MWLHEAPCADDSDVLRWFTRTILQEQPEGPFIQPKRTHLNIVLRDNKWTQHKNRVKELVRLQHYNIYIYNMRQIVNNDERSQFFPASVAIHRVQ